MENTAAPLVTSLIYSVILYSVLPVVGLLVDFFEKLELRLFSGVFGSGIGSFVCNWVTFPGTILHELSHAMFAVITGAKITSIGLLDFFKGDQLGHVEFIPRGPFFVRAFQMVLTSAAPVIVGLPAAAGLILFMRENSLSTPGKVIVVYLIVSILNHASMSWPDLKIYLRGLSVAIPVTTLVLFGLMHFGVIPMLPPFF